MAACHLFIAFAFSAPVGNGQSILVDFFTSAISGAVIRKAAADWATVPLGMTLIENGNDTGDPEQTSRVVFCQWPGSKVIA